MDTKLASDFEQIWRDSTVVVVWARLSRPNATYQRG